MSEPLRDMAAFTLLVLGCALLLAVTAGATRPAIDANRERQLADALSALAGRTVTPSALTWRDGRASLCDGTLLLRGNAAGYAGDIHWLAVAAGGRLTGLKVVAHQETPGIGDFLNHPDVGWLQTLIGLDAAGITAVDAVSGATISSRALRRSLAEAVMAATPAAATASAPPDTAAAADCAS